jgi:hypothetical protein
VLGQITNSRSCANAAQRIVDIWARQIANRNLRLVSFSNGFSTPSS